MQPSSIQLPKHTAQIYLTAIRINSEPPFGALAKLSKLEFLNAVQADGPPFGPLRLVSSSIQVRRKKGLCRAGETRNAFADCDELEPRSQMQKTGHILSHLRCSWHRP
jgi:hypothetical protein